MATTYVDMGFPFGKVNVEIKTDEALLTLLFLSDGTSVGVTFDMTAEEDVEEVLGFVRNLRDATLEVTDAAKEMLA